MRNTSLKLSILALVVVTALTLVPAASANSFNLTANNLGISGSVGTVTTTQNGSNVDVTITMNAGFTILTNGGFIAFNLNGLTLTGSSLTNFSVSGMSSSLQPNTTIGGFTFSQIFQTHHTGGQLFTTTLSFTVLNANVSQITGLGIHFCVLDVTGACSGNTGFASTGGPPVPEPGTLGLLGTGLIGIAGLLRRRFVS